MWDKIRHFLAPPVFVDDEDKTRIAALLNPLILSVFGMDMIGVVATIFIFANKLGSAITVGLIFLVLLTSKILLQRRLVRSAGMVFIIGMWFPISAVVVLAAGRHMIPVAYVALTIVAGLVVGQGAAIVIAVVSSILYLGIAIVEAMGIVLPRVFADLLVSNWVLLSISLAMTVMPLNMALRSLGEALGRARTYATEAERQRRELETLAEERATELTRRAGYLGATTEIAAEVAIVGRDLQTLLNRVVDVVSQQFGFYHTGIFLLDERNEWAVLQAASSAGGQQMMQRGHRLRVGTEGIVGAVAAYGQHRIAQDVGADAVYFDNPDLPETRSEIGLPLRVRSEIIGVLDVQSTAPAAFTAEDVTVLQALADQVSVAVSNVRLLRQVEESVTAERRAYGQRAREAWQEFLRARPDLAFASDAHGVTPFDAWEPEMKAAAQTGHVVGEGEAVAIPLRVREQVIGVIDGRKPDGTAWSPDEISLLQTLAEQLSTALEGAQLYEDTQRRAAREQLAREITDRMRSTVSWDELMQTAIQQMADAVGVSRSFVHWIPPEAVKPAGEGDHRA